MKHIICALSLCLAALPAFAAQKDCEELKSAIAAKVEGKGVKNYQLEIVGSETAKEGRVVGSCEMGKKKIVYKKT